MGSRTPRTPKGTKNRQRPTWPGSGPSEKAVRRRLRRERGREPSRKEVAAVTVALSSLGAARLLQHPPAGPGR